MGELLVGGDWACAEGDAATLSHVAELLALCFAEPYRTNLIEISHLGHSDPELAATRWADLRVQLRSKLPQATQEMPVAW
ncbi:MAG TPA: hypothetical protein VL463_00635 [Kofleriaceae bacterium]|nr:hypothetical protein [Kofleriaceae bacterium]